jgi:2-(1,2-epoxy-1,2-dihydrophenyl)acetyl-CoA isomerase
MLNRMEYEFIKIIEKDNAVELVLNRPNSLNALSTPMLKEIRSALSYINSLPQNIIVLRGEGRTFCVGGDVKEIKGGVSFNTYFERVSTLQEIASLLRETEKIIIAVLHGHVVGGGMIMSLYADIRIAAEGTVFRLPEIDVGSTVLCGGHKILLDNIGSAKTREFLFLGESLSVDDAEELNLINKKVPSDKLGDALQGYIDKFSSKPSKTLKVIKMALRQASDGKFGDMLNLEAVDALRNFHYRLEQGKD